MNYESVAKQPFEGARNQAISNAPTPISPMQEARASVSGAIAYLHDRLSELERRAEPVCLPIAPSPVGSGTRGSEVDTRSPSEFRLFLLAQAESVAHAIARVESVLSRLEL